MNVLLVRPPSIMGGEHSHAQQHPVTLCCLAAYIQQEDFSVQIIDYEVLHWSEKKFATAIHEFEPAVIGFTAMTPSIETVGRMASVAKKASPEAITVIGGPHVSTLPLETMRQLKCFDAAVIGEGEEALLRICRAVRDNAFGAGIIPSVISRAGGEIIGDPADRLPPLDLDTLPIPARELLHLKSYSGAPTPGIAHDGSSATQLFTARGCPGKCIFCCSENVFGRRVRSRSVDHVMAEIHNCMDRFGFRHFTIDNDTFTFDRDFAMEFCARMSELDATWDCDTRVDRVDADLLQAMADSGCLKVAFGVETGSERILKLIKKGITHQQVRDAFAATRKTGMLSCAFLMLGNHPDETEEDINATRDFVREIKPDLISVALATPYPGTQLYEIMKEENLMDELPWKAYQQSFHGTPFVRTNTISPKQLLDLQSKMLRDFYTSPGYIFRRLKSIKNPRELKYWMDAGRGFLKYVMERGR